MEKIKKKINIQNLFVIFIIMQPIIDMITSILVRHVSETFTLGIIIRALFMVIVAIYALIISDKKYRIGSLIYYVILGIYMLAFVFVMYKENSTNMIFTQIKGVVKAFYLPVILISLYPIFKKHKIHLSDDVFIYTLLGYTGIMLIARIFNIAYPTYSIGLNIGTVGLFYAANEIGVIICILSGFLANKLMKEENKITKKTVFYVISLAIYVFAVLEMGTKVPILGFLALLVGTIFIAIIKIFQEDKKKYIQKLVGIVVLLIVILFTAGYTPVGKNIERNYGISFPKIEFKENENNNGQNETKKFNTVEEATTAAISGRDIFLKDNMEKFKNSNVENKLVGIGYVDKTEDGELGLLKTVEIDYFDIFLLQGIIGFILFFTPVLIALFIILKKILKNIKIAIFDLDVLYMLFSLAISFGIALFAGHTLVAPAVSIYIAIIIIQLNKRLDVIQNDNKIEG